MLSKIQEPLTYEQLFHDKIEEKQAILKFTVFILQTQVLASYVKTRTCRISLEYFLTNPYFTALLLNRACQFT